VDTVLRQALQLTGLGMGMTFASIGALVLGMLLLTRITSQRAHAVEESFGDGSDAPTPAMSAAGSGPNDSIEPAADDPGALVAAAAVAVALAQDRTPAAAAAAAVAVAVASSGPVPEAAGVRVAHVDAWNGYVRGLHLSARAGYDARRTRV